VKQIGQIRMQSTVAAKPGQAGSVVTPIMNMEGAAMDGVSGEFDKTVSNRNKEGNDGSGEFQDVNTDIAGAATFTEVRW
jgi:hypothetical protein